MKGEAAVFVITAKLPRRRLALGAAAAALLCCCMLALRLFPAAEPVSGPAAPDVTGIRTNQDRVEFLSVFGWEVSPEPTAVQELLIPQEMDDSFSEYLELQTSQGFDLSRYAGKRVKRYTYSVLNHPSGEENVQANLLVFRHRVVGGEVLSPKPDGFLHGLKQPRD